MTYRTRNVVNAEQRAFVSTAAAALGQRGGLAAAAKLSKKARVARARKAGLASAGAGGGWPKGKKRGPRKPVAR